MVAGASYRLGDLFVFSIYEQVDSKTGLLYSLQRAEDMSSA